jgi:DNA (cytosine-5)-methyltransferase 1
MRLLDLFSGAGGAAMGYHRAGFEVVGVDIEPQPRYPFDFVQADALEYVAAHGHEFDVLHASPPCQAYSMTKNLKTSKQDHPDLVEIIRHMLVKSNKPYVIENVPGAPLFNPLMLCGSMFDLGVIRHRLFETSPAIWWPPGGGCQHKGPVCPMWWKSRRKALAEGKTFNYIAVAGKSFLMPEAKRAMGIDWMIRREISQSIPPAYTTWLGQRIVEAINA